MSKLLRQAVENRRNELINKLIAFNIYKKENVHLYELSLTDLENEYRQIQLSAHPHSDIGSIHWTKKNAKNS